MNFIQNSKGIWSNKSYSTLLFYLVFLILFGLIISQLLACLFCMLVFNESFFLGGSLEVHIESLKTIQFFNALGTFIFPTIAFIHLRGLSFYNYLKLNFFQFNRLQILLFVLAIVMIPLANYMGAINQHLPYPEVLSFLKDFEEQSLWLTEQFLQMDTYFDFLLMILLIAVVASVGEELLFRGILQNLFQEWFASKHASVWMTAFLFSVMHLQYHAILPRFVLGAVIGYVYLISGNLFYSILLHFFYNSILVLITFMIRHEILEESWNVFGEGDVTLFVFALLIFLSLFFKLIKPQIDH